QPRPHVGLGGPAARGGVCPGGPRSPPRLLPLGASGSDARPFAERLPGRGRGAYRNRHISTRLEGRVVREAMEVPTKVASRRDSSRVPEERVWSTQRGGSDLSMLRTACQRQWRGGILAFLLVLLPTLGWVFLSPPLS